MLKKILAVLAIVGMLCGVGATTAMAKDAPWQHKAIYKYTHQDYRSFLEYMFEYGNLNIMLLMFGLVKLDAYFPSADAHVSIEGNLMFGEIYLIVTASDGMIYVEALHDNDRAVDAVAKIDKDGFVVLRYIGNEVPSIYTTCFRKIMSKIIHNEVYNSPIKHAVIKMGD